MLDMRVVRKGTVTFEAGEISLEGWKVSGEPSCREHAAIVLLWLAQRFIEEANATIDCPGGSGRVGID